MASRMAGPKSNEKKWQPEWQALNPTKKNGFPEWEKKLEKWEIIHSKWEIIYSKWEIIHSKWEIIHSRIPNGSQNGRPSIQRKKMAAGMASKMAGTKPNEKKWQPEWQGPEQMASRWQLR